MNKPAKLIVDKLVDTLSEPPKPTLVRTDSEVEVERMIQRTAWQTSSISAALAVPGGFTGLITVLPEVASIWKLQAQLISNIAAVHGKDYMLSREQMLWCMFRQMGYGVIKEYVIQQGGVYLVKKMKSKAFESVLQKVGINLVSRQGTRLAGKVIPVLGSVSAGALSYYDTRKVGRNALQLYSHPIQLIDPPGSKAS